MSKSKLFFLGIVLAVLMPVFVSCGGTQTITVNGMPGTVIGDPSNQQIAVIDQTGTAKILLKRKAGYIPYLYATAPGSDVPVPFALDYKTKGTAGNSVALGGAYTLAGIGAIGVLTAATMLALSGDSDGKSNSDMTNTGAVILGVGVAAAGAGYGLYEVSDPKGKKTYNYLQNQTTNNDLVK